MRDAKHMAKKLSRAVKAGKAKKAKCAPKPKPKKMAAFGGGGP